MGTAQESVLGIVIDVCTRSFLLLSDEGNEKEVQCDTVQEFMNVLEGETLGIMGDDGKAAVMMPADDEIVRIYTEHNEAS
jgi:hypothetical protein